METIAKIRRAHFAQKKPIKAICREFRVSRKVVRKVIRSGRRSFAMSAASSRCRESVRGAVSSTVCCWRTRARRRASG